MFQPPQASQLQQEEHSAGEAALCHQHEHWLRVILVAMALDSTTGAHRAADCWRWRPSRTEHISSMGAECSLEGWRDAADHRGLQGRASGLDRAGSSWALLQDEGGDGPDPILFT